MLCRDKRVHKFQHQSDQFEYGPSLHCSNRRNIAAPTSRDAYMDNLPKVASSFTDDERRVGLLVVNSSDVGADGIGVGDCVFSA